MTGRMLIGVCLLVMTDGAAEAQQPPTESAPAAVATRINPDDLPLSVNRVRQRLIKAQQKTGKHGLRLDYYIDVYGKAPKLVIFADGEDIGSGPVPFSAPTHQDFLDFVTPQQFRSPVMNLSNVAAAIKEWAADRAAQKKRKKQSER